MAAPYVPNTAYMYFQFVSNSRPVGFGYNCEFLAPPYDQSDIDGLAALGDTWVDAYILDLLSNETAYVETVVRGLTAPIDLTAIDNTNAAVGNNAFEAMPNNVAWVVKHTTGFTGRSARGRTYMPAIPVNFAAANEDFVIQQYADDVEAAFVALDVVLDAAGWDGVVVSRYTGGVLRPTPVTLTITGHSHTDLRLDTRRKRLG